MTEFLNRLDTDLFLLINGFHNGFFDYVMVFASAKFSWLPFYLFLVYLMVREYKWKTLLVLLFVAIAITVSDQVSVHAFKNVFQRLRPCHNPDLALVIHTVGSCGGQFGFISSHAANSFAVAAFVAGILGGRYKWIVWVMFAWAALIAYSRVYLGVHYPGDVLAGAAVGWLIGWVVLKGFYYVELKITQSQQ